jgi:FlaA1/EpsC-like NDP-sugar epimerase
MFFRAFSSVVRQMSGYNSQRRGTACTSQLFFFLFIMYVPFSVFCVLFVCKCVLLFCPRVSTQLQLQINNSNNNDNNNRKQKRQLVAGGNYSSAVHCRSKHRCMFGVCNDILKSLFICSIISRRIRNVVRNCGCDPLN